MERSGPALLPPLSHWSGVAATVAGVGFWAWMLLQPVPASAPPVRSTAVSGRDPATAQALARWFDPAAAQLDIHAKGVLRGAGRDVALLSVDSGPEQAYVIGEALGPSARLRAIETDTVVVEHAGALLRIAVPRLPEPPAEGLQRLPPEKRTR